MVSFFIGIMVCGEKWLGARVWVTPIACLLLIRQAVTSGNNRCFNGLSGIATSLKTAR